MATVSFYNVKKKASVDIDQSGVTKVKYERKTKSGDTRTSYAVKAVDDDGTKLTKFMSAANWQALDAKEG
jgi:hypothetical protein